MYGIFGDSLQASSVLLKWDWLHLAQHPRTAASRKTTAMPSFFCSLQRLEQARRLIMGLAAPGPTFSHYCK